MSYVDEGSARAVAARAMRGLCMLIALVLTGACAPLAPRDRPADDPGVIACQAQFARVDRVITQARVGDAQARPVAGFPYLRVDRFLASFADEVEDVARFDHWRAQLRALDREGRAVELSNLSVRSMSDLATALGVAAEPAALSAELDRCAALLMRADDAVPARRARLREAARVPDDYDTWKRVAGAYWLTRLPFSAGVAGYQREVMRTFAQPLAALPVQGRLRRYTASTSTPAPRGPLARDALGIPQPSDEQRDDLFAAHAPDWIVDEAGPDDRIGAIAWDGHVATVDTRDAVIYHRLAYTRFGGDVLMQLVYSAWFPARPRGAGIDLLSGRLDSVVWRVTLDRDGVPLLYDSMHGCGCYHQFFPTARLRTLPARAVLEEGALVPQSLGDVGVGQRVGLRIAAATHYLQRVLIDAPRSDGAGPSDDSAPPGASVTYAMRPDSTLRALPTGEGGTRSAFGPDGIVAGSERGERYLFWPMGVREPGAMRQWGRHATAFMGRRHFDEARLIERYFARSGR